MCVEAEQDAGVAGECDRCAADVVDALFATGVMFGQWVVVGDEVAVGVRSQDDVLAIGELEPPFEQFYRVPGGDVIHPGGCVVAGVEVVGDPQDARAQGP